MTQACTRLVDPFVDHLDIDTIDTRARTIRLNSIR